jgi:2-desacetyl-2-hydroxyethyl bacteriochlorophyllide A dehydrogenase
MYAKALICDAEQRFSIEDVLLPDPGPDEIAIRTHYSGVSIGTEFALIRNKISWGPYPLCTGYMGTGTVEKIGDQIDNFEVGDRVYYRRNGSMKLVDGSAVSCVSGAHASLTVLPPNTTHGAAHVPAGLSMETAAMFVMPAVGLYGVDIANPRMGETVVVHGVGPIGLGVVACCVHRGCIVIAVDINPLALQIAREFGADVVIDGTKQDVTAEIARFAPEGADAVFECTGLPQCINPAIALCRKDGSFVWQGNYGAAPISLDFLPAHGRRLRMFFPCDDGLQPCRRAVVKNMAMGTLPWEKTITHRIAYTEAPEMFNRINQGAKDVLGVAIHWPD